MPRAHNAIDRCVVRLKLTPANKAKYMQNTPVMVEGWNELPADFETEKVQ
jgi:hypothetical protein